MPRPGSPPSVPPLSSIRITREKLGVSQALLARVTGINASTISRIENATLTPGYDTAATIFLALRHLAKRRGLDRPGAEEEATETFQAELPALLKEVIT